jgi:hypothetical protein
MVRRQLSHHSRYSGSSRSSSHSDDSDNTHSMAPSTNSERSLLKYYHDRSYMYYDRTENQEKSLDLQTIGSPRSSFDSVDTYASTVPSQEDLTHEPGFQVHVDRHEVYASDATPSTPANFAELFPSSRRLFIHHDDSTSDGNMNLRVDTEITGSGGRRRKVILFHLRMHDLKDRRFSLRRHGRESGREICSSARKYAAPAPIASTRSNIQQSLGQAFQQLRLTNEASVTSLTSTRRRDPGYGTNEDEAYQEAPAVCRSPKAPQSPTNTTHLEFSNYAHIEVNQRGSKRSKRYEYEFWGVKYEWKRQIYREGPFEEISYHLINEKTSKSIAHITPEVLTAREAQEEEDLGSWVPPCTMRITDRSVFRGLTDVAE